MEVGGGGEGLAGWILTVSSWCWRGKDIQSKAEIQPACGTLKEQPSKAVYGSCISGQMFGLQDSQYILAKPSSSERFYNHNSDAIGSNHLKLHRQISADGNAESRLELNKDAIGVLSGEKSPLAKSGKQIEQLMVNDLSAHPYNPVCPFSQGVNISSISSTSSGMNLSTNSAKENNEYNQLKLQKQIDGYQRFEIGSGLNMDDADGDLTATGVPQKVQDGKNMVNTLFVKAVPTCIYRLTWGYCLGYKDPNNQGIGFSPMYEPSGFNTNYTLPLRMEAHAMESYDIDALSKATRQSCQRKQYRHLERHHKKIVASEAQALHSNVETPIRMNKAKEFNEIVRDQEACFLSFYHPTPIPSHVLNMLHWCFGIDMERKMPLPRGIQHNAMVHQGLSSLIAAETLLSIHMHARLFPMCGSRFIQQKLQNATPEEKFMVFEEIMPDAIELVMDIYGNYVLQKVATGKSFTGSWSSFNAGEATAPAQSTAAEGGRSRAAVQATATEGGVAGDGGRRRRLLCRSRAAAQAKAAEQGGGGAGRQRRLRRPKGRTFADGRMSAQGPTPASPTALAMYLGESLVRVASKPLIGDTDFPDIFEMYATEASFHLLVAVLEEGMDVASVCCVHEPIAIIPPENPCHNDGSGQAAINVGGSAQPTTVEADVRKPDMFDNEEEYVGVNDEQLYLPPKPTQPPDTSGQSSQPATTGFGGQSSQPAAIGVGGQSFQTAATGVEGS
ncbi:hypothetical protein OsJ_18085 [Oryza sativa Japonica Group]|uniref:PUM-HD domain-containing protein n=1 Tax=Oryza sativa subsp. japonica TaxID=39947 RepID=B9FNX1_ORYSJ|nr:hypothetical protein OsJ_18085 [Oryza sativa Japonica Group]